MQQLDNLDLTILKALITNKKYAIEFISECDTSVFSPDALRFAKTITDHTKTFKELPTYKVLEDKHQTSNPTLFKYLSETWAQVEAAPYNEHEFHYNLHKIKNRFAEKQIATLQTSLTSQKDVAKHITDIQKTVASINQLSNHKTYEIKTLKEALPGFVDAYNAKKNTPDLETGMKTGYSYIDYATNGIKKADLVLIAGESGHGKSILLLNIAIQSWLQSNSPEQGAPFSKGKNIVFFSLEMPFDECLTRLISRLSMVPSRKIENATLTKEEFAKVKAALDFIKRYQYHFKIVDMADACADDIERILSDIDFDIDAVFIDYLGIMKPNVSNKEEQDWLRQGMIAYEVRAVGRKMDLPIFSAVQLNRKTAGKDSESVGLSRVARSGTIATHATLILQIESRPNEIQIPDMSIAIIKNRRGLKGQFQLMKHLHCAYLKDIPFTVPNEYDSYFPNADNVDDISEDIEEIEQLELGE